jgi:hypothetical protein
MVHHSQAVNRTGADGREEQLELAMSVASRRPAAVFLTAMVAVVLAASVARGGTGGIDGQLPGDSCPPIGSVISTPDGDGEVVECFDLVEALIPEGMGGQEVIPPYVPIGQMPDGDGVPPDQYDPNQACQTPPPETGPLPDLGATMTMFVQCVAVADAAVLAADEKAKIDIGYGTIYLEGKGLKTKIGNVFRTVISHNAATLVLTAGKDHEEFAGAVNVTLKYGEGNTKVLYFSGFGKVGNHVDPLTKKQYSGWKSTITLVEKLSVAEGAEVVVDLEGAGGSVKLKGMKFQDAGFKGTKTFTYIVGKGLKE